MPPKAEQLRRSPSEPIESSRVSTASLFSVRAPEAMTAPIVPERRRSVFYFSHIDAFDPKPGIMRGEASRSATSILRRSFRNWFQLHGPHIFSSFRVAEA